jgi:hypothetical protein
MASFAYDSGIPVGRAKRGKGPRTHKQAQRLQERRAREEREMFAEPVEEDERDD